MNAIDLLLSEHRSHRERLDEIETDKDAFSAFRDEFIHHINAEETILYPHLLKIPELEPTLRTVWEEHSICRQLVQEMDSMDISSPAWDAKFSILKKLALSHLDEEENLLFPRIKEAASDDLLQEIGDQMMARELFTETDVIMNPDGPEGHKWHP